MQLIYPQMYVPIGFGAQIQAQGIQLGLQAAQEMRQYDVMAHQNAHAARQEAAQDRMFGFNARDQEVGDQRWQADHELQMEELDMRRDVLKARTTGSSGAKGGSGSAGVIYETREAALVDLRANGLTGKLTPTEDGKWMVTGQYATASSSKPTFTDVLGGPVGDSLYTMGPGSQPAPLTGLNGEPNSTLLNS